MKRLFLLCALSLPIFMIAVTADAQSVSKSHVVQARTFQIPRYVDAENVQPEQFGDPANPGWYVGTQVYSAIKADVAKPLIAAINGPDGHLAFVDTGFNPNPALASHMPPSGVWGLNFVPGKPSTYLTDDFDHGTRVASQADMVVSGDSHLKFWIAKVDDNGTVYYTAVIAALQFILDQRNLWNDSRGSSGMNFTAVNISIGFPGADTFSDITTVRDLARQLGEAGTFCAFAAGNQERVNDPVYNLDVNPEGNRGGAEVSRCVPGGVNVVGTETAGNQVSRLSYFGSQTTDIGAPAVSNIAVGADGTIHPFGGTSAASPQAAAVGAELVRSGLTPLAARRQITSTGDPSLPLNQVKGGRFLNVAAAFSTAVPASMYNVHEMATDIKPKYKSASQMLIAEGVSDSDVCAQTFGGYYRALAGGFSGSTTGPFGGGKVLFFSKEGGTENRKAKVR